VNSNTVNVRLSDVNPTDFFLKSSVAIDLKMSEFGASYKGTGKNEEHIELMQFKQKQS
jgi:hypothetical protein